MRLNLYSIMDSKAKTYARPFLFQHDGEALRAFQGSVQKGDTQLSQFPEDFILYKIGSFDDQSAEIASIKPVYVGKAVDYVKVRESVTGNGVQK